MELSMIVGRVVDPHFIFSALIGAFFAALIFATVTTVRHVSHQEGTISAARP
jgi:hypothetical protein